MARQRLVKPDVFQHEELHRAETVSALPLRLAYIGLWTQCDRRGCFAWKPVSLKLNVLPFDDVDFSAVLSALESAGFIRSYVVEGKRYGQVPTLPDHQTFHIHEKPNPLIPDPPDSPQSTVPVPSLHSASTSVSVVSTGTASSTGTAVIGGAAADDVATATVELTTAANRAIADRFGEQASPLLASSGKAHQFAEQVVAAGIPVDFAARSVARQVLHIEKPVRAMTYFTPGVLDDWAKHNANKAVNGAKRVTPLTRNGQIEQTRPRRGGSPPVEGDATLCGICGTKETHIVNRRNVPKHKDGCVLAAATAGIGR